MGNDELRLVKGSQAKTGILKESSDFSQLGAVERLTLRNVRFKSNTVGASRSTQQVKEPKVYNYNTWTLILTCPSQQAEFTAYLRKKTRSYASVLLPAIAVMCIASFGLLLMPEGLTRQTLTMILALYGVPVVFAGVIFTFSKKYAWLAELIGPGMTLPFAISLLVFNTVASVPEELYRVQYMAIATLYAITALFLSTSYFKHLIFRLSMTLLMLGALLAFRISVEEEFSVIAYILMNVACIPMVETTIYINVKAQLKLFVLLKNSEREQKQLANLLDTVPDNVFICTKGSESSESQRIYANLKMNTFFGGDIVNYKKDDKFLQKKSMLKSVTKSTQPGT